MKKLHVGTNPTNTRRCGVTGTMTTQHAVCGGSKITKSAGTKNGASGKMIGVGHIMESGKWDTDQK